MNEIVDRKALHNMLESDNDTWFGQLMSKPQLIAWLIQLEMWLEHYDIAIHM